jgi:integrase
MPVRRNQRGRWIYRTVVELPNGEKVRIFGTPAVDTQERAKKAERAHIERVLNAADEVPKKEVPTFETWFWGEDATADEPSGRFWTEWVIGRKNKPSEMEAKKSIYRTHLQPMFGSLRLDEIGVSEISQLRSKLVQDDLSEKRINNILSVLSKTLRYAAEIELIERVPRIGLLKVERPEIEPWSFSEYARLLRAARSEGQRWVAALCLAGEAGLRTGEIKALRWREDVDLVGGTITVNQQVRRGIVGTPKGRTRRIVPMTITLLRALKSIEAVREGLVFCNDDGSEITDGQGQAGLYRICRVASLPERQWHVLRHCFATHAAMFGVNPWSLQSWMGHKRIEETMIYVNYANAHRSPIPPEILTAVTGEMDPDQRVLGMLSARARVTIAEAERRGTQVASGPKLKREAVELRLVN